MLALVVSVARDELEIASDRLWSLGVIAIEERSTHDIDVVELWSSLGDDADDLALRLEALGHPWRLEDVDASVADTWRQFAEPNWIARDLVVYPAWQTSPTSSGRSADDDDVADVIAISIEPGATFGMGDHPTTIATIRAMRTVLTTGATVLDVGCGSGVLAIAACRLGAGSAVAIDVSPAAVPITRANAEQNAVGDQIAVSTTRLDDVEGCYDVIVANILAPALIELAPHFRRMLAPGGALVISGILADKHQHVLDALRPLRPTSVLHLDGWAAVTLRE